MPAPANLVHEVSTSTGTGDLTVSAVNGRQRFSTAFGTGGSPDIFDYFVSNRDAAEYERGTAHCSSAGVLVRDTVIESTNANALVNFSAGTKDVMNDVPAASQYRVGGTDVAVADGGTGASTSVVAFTTLANAGGGFNAPFNLGLAASAASSALTIALKGANGNDPSATNAVLIPFRNATAVTGTPTWLSVTAATSLVVPSTATLGVTSATGFRLWVALFSDGQLGVINCSTATQIFPLAEGQLTSAVALSTGSDSAGVFYTTSTVTTLPFRILGYLSWSSSGLTAGTWTTTNLLYIQLFGPGIKKPGDVVQTVQGNTASQTDTTSSTYQTTAVSAAITPTSAANKVFILAVGPVLTNTAANAAVTSIHRDSTAVGPVMFTQSGAANTLVCGTMNVIDSPNSISAITYAVKVKSANNVNSVSFPYTAAGGTGYIQVREIMT